MVMLFAMAITVGSHSPDFRVGSHSPDCHAVISDDVAAGNLYSARRAAVGHSSRPESGLPMFASGGGSTVDATECAAAWSMAVDALLERPDAFALIDAAHRQHAHAGLIVTHRKGLKCADEHWESCCSSLQTSTCKDTERRECCHMGNGTRAHLRLPALREIAIDVRLPTGRLIRIEQDARDRRIELDIFASPLHCRGIPHTRLTSRVHSLVNAGVAASV